MESVILRRMDELAECILRMAMYAKQFGHNFSEEITVANEVRRFVEKSKTTGKTNPARAVALYEEAVASLGTIHV